MARPTNAARLDRSAEEAENLIRARLVELTEVAINTALLPEEVPVCCPKCGTRFKAKLEGTTGDPGLALKLLERVAGKATEKRDSGVAGELEKLLVNLSGTTTPVTTTSATVAAEAAKEKARRRAQLAAALKGAAVTP